MNTIIEMLFTIHNKINKFVWGPPMLIFFLFVGIMFTIRSNFFQITGFRQWINKTILACFKKENVVKTKDENSISQWQALTTALASTSGTGNIAGVATALVAGGPGAIFWMWISAFFGMMTHYAEIVLGLHYRYKDKKGAYVGGPMVYMERGLKSKFLASLFAFFCIFATLGIGNMSQSNSMADAIYHTFGIPKLLVGTITAILVVLVILGGVKRIAAVNEKLVPFMSILYLIGAVWVILSHYYNIPAAFASILREAFQFKAASGGFLGYGMSLAIQKGISRGVFSNEAGLGSSVIIHSAADTKEPVVQGMWGIFEVFVDTIVVCTITALTILTSDVYHADNYLNAMRLDFVNGNTNLLDTLPNGVNLTANAFSSTFGNAGNIFVTISIILFALATLIGWSYYGEKCCQYLFGTKSIHIYKILYCVFIIIGAISRLDFVWNLSDTFNGLMAVPNLIAITLLSKKVIQLSKDYFKRNPK
jgi:amino acid carrier protein